MQAHEERGAAEDMKISKKDALAWFEFFAGIEGEAELSPRQTEIVYAVLRQIERRVEWEQEQRMRAIPGLKSLQGRTFYVGADERFPRGCRSCLLGTGLSAVRRTNTCNIQCRFCYNYGEWDMQEPIGEDLFEVGGGRYTAEDLEMAMEIQGKPSGISYVYLEPFMEIEKYYDVIAMFHRHGVYQHMYTNGLLCTEENLRCLAEAGLDELRFNLGATDCSDVVIRNMETASGLLPMTGIETPMTPEFSEQFHEKKDRILSSGISFMNLAELHLNPNNIDNYAGENLYMSRLGYVSPVWSRLLSLDLMKEASEEAWKIAVHDCSNRTKRARDLNWKKHEGGCFGSTVYGREFEEVPVWAFLPVLQDPEFTFLEEEPLPKGYRVGELLM